MHSESTQEPGLGTFAAMASALNRIGPTARPVRASRPKSLTAASVQAAAAALPASQIAPGRFPSLTSMASARDILVATSDFANEHGCEIVAPRFVQVADIGHPDPAAYAQDQALAAGALTEVFNSNRVGDLVLWSSKRGDGSPISGITYVAPSYSLAADLVIGLYRLDVDTSISDDCIGMFTLLCTTIANPRNRILLADSFGDFKPLSQREIEALKLSTNGSTAREVAGVMGITARTVDSHIQAAMIKMGCTSKVHAIVKATRLGLL